MRKLRKMSGWGRAGWSCVGPVIFALGTLGCEGILGSDGSGATGSASGGDGEMDGGGDGDAREATCEGDASVAVAPLRRLTRAEYENTVSDIFSVVPRATQLFTMDERSGGYASNAVVPVGDTQVAAYYTAAEETAVAAMETASDWLPCMNETMDDSCLDTFFHQVARRLFRRPLIDEEVSALRAAYEEKLARSSPTEGVTLLLTALLQSPSFLYRVEDVVLEPGESAPVENVAPLDDYELATRLAFFLWNSGPDDELLDAASAGVLGQDPEWASQVERMLSDVRAERALKAFHLDWLESAHLLGASKDEVLFPQWNDELKQSMLTETTSFANEMYLQGGTFEDLFTAPYSYVNAPLAQLYGLEGGGASFEKRTFDDGRRAGILTHASFLAANALAVEASPILRGKFVRTQIFCQTIDPPPKGIVIVPPAIDPNLSTRERFDAHAKDATCQGCHQFMDPIGFGFQHFDAIGAYTDMDGTHVADATGELLGTDVDGPFDGAIELGERIARSDEAEWCLSRQWLRFQLGRVETKGEACSLGDASSPEEGSFTLRDLLTQVTTTPAFRQKILEQAGVAP